MDLKKTSHHAVNVSVDHALKTMQFNTITHIAEAGLNSQAVARVARYVPCASFSKTTHQITLIDRSHYA